MTINEMTAMYNNLAYTHNYIFGFTYKRRVIACKATGDMLTAVCELDKASRNEGESLRFRPNKAQKALLMENGYEVICTEAELEAENAATIYNRGEIFEKMVTEAAGQEWKKDHIPFTQAGDLTINGIAYQIKFQKATFCNAKTLRNLSTHL